MSVKTDIEVLRRIQLKKTGFHRNDETEIELHVVIKQRGRADFPVTNPETSPPLLN
jgi:hypothetical protein